MTYTFDFVRLGVVMLLVGINGFFVAAEFALVRVRWTRIEELVAQKKFGALAVQRAIEHLDDAIAACQLGITLASLALGWLGEPALAHLIEPIFRPLPTPWGPVFTHGLAIGVAYLLLTYLHVVLGEQAPKALAIERAEDVALGVTIPLLTFGRVFKPLIVFIRVSSTWIVKLFRLPPMQPHKEVHSVEELQMLVEETEEAGVIPADQATYVQNVFELSSKTVRDVMIPREKVVTLSLRSSPDEILDTSRSTAHTRMPVWADNPDNIVGIVNTKNLFHLFSLKGVVILMDAMYEPIFVLPEMSVARLLRVFKRVRRPMAIVQDEHGTFLGIVTLEDILEEIVGEIEDEHDVPAAAAAAAVKGMTLPGAATGTGASAMPPKVGAAPELQAPPTAKSKPS
jgi:CBS domain containing-hemolysin-like protein